MDKLDREIEVMAIGHVETNGKEMNDYDIEGYDEEGVIGEVTMYEIDGRTIHVVEWLPHSEKGLGHRGEGNMKEILKID
jgi:hypothetical protein